jgi:hypothetical protein
MSTPNKLYICTSLTGGGAGALDSINGLGLRDGDKAIYLSSSAADVYTLDSDSGLSESSPGVISPDDNAGDKRWIRGGSVSSTYTTTTAVTYATVRALNTDDYSDGDVVFVTCRTSNNDGGQGFFYYISGAGVGTYSDDGGTVLLPSGGDGSAAWLRLYDGQQDPGWYDSLARSEDTSSDSPNTIYVNGSTGNDDDNGLDSGNPVATLQRAVDVLEWFGPELSGYWEISVAAGTYTEGLELYNLKSENRISIKGPDVSGGVPTAIIDGTTATKTRGIKLDTNVLVYVKDIKAQDFSQGFYVAKDSIAYFINCHGYNNTAEQLIVRDQAYAYIGGGIYDGVAKANGYVGVKVIDSRIDLGYDDDTVTIQNCGQGVYMWEHSNGHVDYCDIIDNSAGVFIAKASRASINYCDFQTNSIAIRCTNNSCYYDTNNEFNHGTADANDLDVLLETGSSPELIFDTYSPSILVHKMDLSYQAHTGDTDETGLKTYADAIEANKHVNSKQRMKIKIYGVTIGTNNTKTIRVKIGSTTIASYAIPSAFAEEFVFDIDVAFVDTANQKIFSQWLGHGVVPVIDYSAKTITLDDSVSDQDIAITGQLANSADSIAVRAIEILRVG